MFLSLRQCVVQRLLGSDRIAVLSIELAGRSVDVERPLGLKLLLALDGAGFHSPRELLCLLRRHSVVERSPVPLVLSLAINLFNVLWSSSLVRHVGALLRHVPA